MAEKIEEKTKNAKNEVKNGAKMPQKPKKAKIGENDFQNLTISGFHDLPLQTYIFDQVIAPKAVVVVVHGMQEHGLRYADFARLLNKNGYVVILTDLRGHGKTIRSKEEYGRGEGDIFAETVEDQLEILRFAKKTYSLPVYVFGHSYGSMITQFLVQEADFIEKAVICGTANGGSLLFRLASAALSVMKPFEKKDKRGGLAENLCIKAYGKKFARGNWLSRDEKVFDKYCSDPLCGGSFPFSFYYSMIKNMRKANKGIEKIGSKKIFLIAGGADPVSSGGKHVRKLHKIYLSKGIDAKMKIYPDARHELINEINKQEVFADVLKFFNEKN